MGKPEVIPSPSAHKAHFLTTGPMCLNTMFHAGPSCSWPGRIPPLITSSLLSCCIRTASGCSSREALARLALRGPRGEKPALPQPPVPTLKKQCSLLDKGRASGHARPDPARGGHWAAQAQALPAFVFASSLLSSFLAPCQPRGPVTVLRFTVTYRSEKLPSERRLFSLHSHPTLDLVAGKLRERETRTGTGCCLDLGQIECAKKKNHKPKTFIENFLHQIEETSVNLKVKLR